MGDNEHGRSDFRLHRRFLHLTPADTMGMHLAGVELVHVMRIAQTQQSGVMIRVFVIVRVNDGEPPRGHQCHREHQDYQCP